MRINRLEVETWRGVTGPVVLEFSPGLTIVAGPNESGKTSLRGALWAALLEKFKTSKKAVTGAQPWGTKLYPTVTVGFEVGGKSYRIKKEFLRSKNGAELYENGTLNAKDDQAQGRLEEILGNAGDWMEVLWSKQGSIEPSPQVSPSLQSCLAAAVKEALTPGVTWLEGQLERQKDTWWTPKGLPNKALKAVREGVHAAERRKEEAESALQASERLVEGVGRDQEALTKSREELAAEEVRLKSLQDGRGAWDRYELARAEIRVTAQQLEAIEKWLAAWEASVRQAVELWGKTQSYQQSLQTLQDRMGARPSRQSVDDLTARRSFLEQFNHRARQARLDELKAPDAKILARVKALSADLQKLDATLQSGELKASLTALRDVEVSLSRDGEDDDPLAVAAGKRASWEADSEFTVEIPGVARLRVEHQNASAESTREKREQVETELNGLLGGASLEELERRSQEAEILRAQLRNIKFDERAWSALRTKVHDATALEGLSLEERERLLAEMPGKVQQAETEYAAAEKQFLEFQDEYQKLLQSNPQSQLSLVMQQMREAVRRAPSLDEPVRLEVPQEPTDGWVLRLRSEEDTQQWKRQRGVLEKSRSTKEGALLRPQGEEVTEKLVSEQQSKVEGLRTKVDTVGRQVAENLGVLKGQSGMYARLAEAEETLLGARDEQRRAEIEALSFKILYDTLQESRQELQREVVAPLSERVGDRLRALTAGRYRGVKFTPAFGLDGVVPMSVDQAALDDVSFGTQEQLMFLVRLCLAEMLGENGEAPVVVLDDNLVHTDAARMRLVCELLEKGAQRVQIIVFTCHPERYEGCREAKLVQLELAQVGVS